MADHTEFLLLAREMIAENGRQVTFGKLSSTPQDTDKPWKGPGAPSVTATVTTMAVFLPVSSLRDLGMNVKDVDLFRQSTDVLMVAPPETGEDLSGFHVYVEGSNIASGNRRKINIIEVLKPGPLALLYAMGASR